MEPDAVDTWLDSYGRAWEARDARAFLRLFSADVKYYWTPFEPPKEGRAALSCAFESATGRQEQISFRSTVLATTNAHAIAHWQCSFVRPRSEVPVHLDGIFVMAFNARGECTLFREWWHSDEASR